MTLIPHPIRLVGAFALISIAIIISMVRERLPVLTRDRLTMTLELAAGAAAVADLCMMVWGVI